MRQKETKTTASLLTQCDDKLEVTPNFVDEDLILIDNIKLLGVPNAVYTNMNLLVLCKKGRHNYLLTEKATKYPLMIPLSVRRR